MVNKPYKSEQFDPSFSLCGHLETHERTHTGENLYRCKPCGKYYYCYWKLKTSYENNIRPKPGSLA